MQKKFNSNVFYILAFLYIFFLSTVSSILMSSKYFFGTTIIGKLAVIVIILGSAILALFAPKKNHLDRMQKEAKKLNKKLVKLEVFIRKGKPADISDDEWELMKQQAEHMALYRNKLESRIKIAESKEKTNVK